MRKRKNGVGAGVGVTMAALAVGGWVAIRLALRQKVNEELEKEGLSEKIFQGNQLLTWFGQDLRMPPAVALAKSIVPLWSTVLPQTALCDIARNGRQSKYWPEDYRTPSDLADWGVEAAAFAELGAELGCEPLV